MFQEPLKMEVQLIRTRHPGGVNGVLLLQGTGLFKTVELNQTAVHNEGQP